METCLLKEFLVEDIRRHDPVLADRIEAPQPLFDEEFGPRSADLTRVRWRWESDPRGRPLIVINISDHGSREGEEATFEPEQLKDTRDFRDRIHDLRGDLIFRALRESVARIQALPVGEDIP